jgi:hypothetical protein
MSALPAESGHEDDLINCFGGGRRAPASRQPRIQLFLVRRLATFSAHDPIV